MRVSVQPMGPAELDRIRVEADAGMGALRTDRGNLPLDRLGVRTTISGLAATSVVTTEFVNVHETALEATYIFPLPDRAAVTGMTMTAAGRTVDAQLQERAAARQTYDRAIEAGQRASIAEQERPDVFTMRVGNILAGERVTVVLRLVGPLPFEDGAATFRFPLVVAPPYIPGAPLPGPGVGSGQAQDTDAAPDASRITPPVLLPGFPNPLRLSIDVDIDAAGLQLVDVRASLYTVTTTEGHVTIAAGERADRDFILRLAYAGACESAVAVPDEGAHPDDADDQAQGTYQLTILPPETDVPPRPKDVVLLLDRSGSMGGWKMVAARRAAARVIDTLTTQDRFAVLTFDHQIERPDDLGAGLVEASDRHRFRAVEHLSRADARGGTEMLAPLHEGLTLLHGGGNDRSAGREDRDRVLVLVTDGQVGNEDQILHDITPLAGSTRIHTVGIDRAVNAGFLGRLAALGAGRCELVESEDRLDEAMEQIHRRIGAPVVTGLAITSEGLTLLEDTRSPARLPGIYPGAPLVVSGRYSGTPEGTLTVTGRTRDDQPFSTTVALRQQAGPAVTAQWARARLRDLEDAYAAGEHDLEARIIATSLRFGVLCRFTGFVAVDSRVVNEGGRTHQVTQPVELPSGWQTAQLAAAPMFLAASGGLLPQPEAMHSGSAPVQAMSRASSGGPRETGAQLFAAMPSSMQSSVGGLRRKAAERAGAPTTVEDMRQIVAVEVRRLHDASDRPGYERRDLLADLVSRLSVLLAGQTGGAYAPLHALLAYLSGDGDLDARWAEARRVLEEFGGAHATARREGFWKR
jgi:Ca-activated chloride channel homolog